VEGGGGVGGRFLRWFSRFALVLLVLGFCLYCGSKLGPCLVGQRTVCVRFWPARGWWVSWSTNVKSVFGLELKRFVKDVKC